MQTKQRTIVTSGKDAGDHRLSSEAPPAVGPTDGMPMDTGSHPRSGSARPANSSSEPDIGRPDARTYVTAPNKPRGDTRATFGPETWVAGPEAFIFWCQDPRRGERWTFCVSRSTLEELAPSKSMKPSAAFDAFRAGIHSAASARMRVADPLVQQVLSAYDIRYARTGSRKDENKRQR
jgi:hypothetical protein